MRVQPDAVLCRLASRGNASAYDVLYERYRQPVFAFVYHLLGRGAAAEDAEDIAQEAFTKGFAAIRERGFEGSFKHWIFTIARNRTFDVIRAKRPVGSLDAEDLHAGETEDLRAGTADRAEQRAELAWLITTVAELPERQREALLLRELGGLSHREIADELDTTVSATKKLINRGRSSVTEAAAVDGYRERHLSRDLALAAPVIPLAASIGVTLTGGAAGAGAAAGGGFAISKIAATVLTVAAVGGGTAVVEKEAHRSVPDGAATAQAEDRAGSPLNAGGENGGRPLAVGGVAVPVADARRGRGEDDRGRRAEDNSGRDGSGRSDRRGSRDDDEDLNDDRPGGEDNSGRGSKRAQRGDSSGSGPGRSGSGSGHGSSGSGSSGGRDSGEPESPESEAGGGGGGQGSDDSGGELDDGSGHGGGED